MAEADAADAADAAYAASAACAECGAKLSAGESCQALFEAFLALEFSDPAFGAVHFLTVACFMIQHGRYSDAALAWIERALCAHLEEGAAVEEIRRQAAQDARQDARTWKVPRQAGEPALPRRAWSMSIAEVAAQFLGASGPADPARYCALVEQWARATLAEMGGAGTSPVRGQPAPRSDSGNSAR